MVEEGEDCIILIVMVEIILIGAPAKLSEAGGMPWKCVSYHNYYIKSKQSTSIFTYFKIFYHKAPQIAQTAAMQVATMPTDHNQTGIRTTMRDQK